MNNYCVCAVRLSQKRFSGCRENNNVNVVDDVCCCSAMVISHTCRTQLNSS